MNVLRRYYLLLFAVSALSASVLWLDASKNSYVTKAIEDGGFFGVEVEGKDATIKVAILAFWTAVLSLCAAVIGLIANIVSFFRKN